MKPVNNVDAGAGGRVHLAPSVHAVMEAFDSLPWEYRERLRYADRYWSAVQMKQVVDGYVPMGRVSAPVRKLLTMPLEEARKITPELRPGGRVRAGRRVFR